jgi:uncharacterized protein YjbI with pentapeptide repeats
LKSSEVNDTDLSNADLRGTDLSDANVYYANLSGAILRGANVRGANLSGAIGVTEQSLERRIVDANEPSFSYGLEGGTMPDGTKRP